MKHVLSDTLGETKRRDWVEASCLAGDAMVLAAVLPSISEDDWHDHFDSRWLFWACRGGSVDVLRLFVPRIIKQCPRHVIHEALECCLLNLSIECAQILIEECGANIKSPSPSLIYALCEPHIIPFLEQLGFDLDSNTLLYPLNEEDEDNSDDGNADNWVEDGSLLHFAIVRDKWDCLRVLLKVRPDVKSKAIEHAVDYWDEGLMDYLKRWCGVSQDEIDDIVEERCSEFN